MSLSNYNYEKYALAGLRGARSLYNMYNATRPVVGSPLTRVQNQVNLLRQTVIRNAPQTSNWQDSKVDVATSAAIGFNTVDYSLTSRFIASSDYSSSVLGDFYRNKYLMLSVDANQSIQKIRIIVYWARKAGNSFQPSNFNSIADPAAFTVLKDQVIFPANLQSFRRFKINLKNKLTNYNQSSSTLEFGDLHVCFVIWNHDTTARGISWQQRLFLQNK